MRRGRSAMVVGVVFLGFIAMTILGTGPARSADLPSPGTTWALCIGIGDYEDPDLVDVPSARNDARGMVRVLETQGGFDHVLALTDDRNPKDPRYPSRTHILATLKDIRDRIRAGDTVFIFFSGHGVTDPGGQTFLLPADAAVRNIPRTGITLGTFLDFLERVDAGTRILCIDGARERIWKQGPRLQAVYPDRYLRLNASAVFYAAQKGTYSHDHAEAPYSVFSRYLIAGLQGEADVQGGGNHDGEVSLMELAAYVDESVRHWSVTHSFTQSPYIRVFRSDAAQLVMARTGEAEADRRLALTESKPPEPSVAPPAPEIEAKPPSSEPEKPAMPEVGPPAPDLPKEPEGTVPPKPERPEVEARKEPGGEGGAVVLGAPAPSIDDVGSKEAPSPGPGADRKQAAPREDAVPEPASAEAKSPEETTRPAVPPRAEAETAAPETAAPAVTPGEKAAEFESEDRDREERLLSGEEAPRLASVPSQGPEELKPETAPAPPPPEPVSLRGNSTDLSSEAVQVLLMEHNFYATCWTYNGDFCNPEGEFANDYRDNGDGTVTDRRTGLMWQKAGSPKPVTWPEADDYVKQLNKERFAGYDDWRLPTVAELASLMERSWLNDDLFLDPVFSSSPKYCWSGDTKGVERAWKANFHLGFFLDFPMSEENSVRAVREVR